MTSNPHLLPLVQATHDVDLENRIASYLYQQRFPCSRRVKTSAASGTVIVRGRLNSAHEKWLCLNTCQRVAGVVRLIDQLAVVPRACLRTQLGTVSRAA
ncbi:MAG: BON domain-containing protein [Planctomycetales bacterium]|nr:BON domain-containing protein [Planctomycetales bacterium]